MNSNQIIRLVQMMLRRRGGKNPRWVLVVIGLCVGYALLQPVLERNGINLPSMTGRNQTSQVESGQSSQNVDFTGPAGGAANSGSASAGTVTAGGAELRDVGRGSLESPAGLVYTRGSKEGHRIKHVMAHSRDQPRRPGQHGVFDANDQGAVVALIDEAYQQGKAGQNTKVEHDDRRAIYTVDMGRRIGFVGGQSGNRKGKPAANHIKLVLEGQRVITAFPLRPYR